MIPEDRLESIIEVLRENSGDRDSHHIKEIGIAVDDALDVHSDDVRADFIDRVIKHLGFVSVKSADGLYATPEKAEQFAQQNEIDADTEWYLMDKKERVEYLTKAVKARSRQGGKRTGVNYNQVRDEVFDGNPSNDYCYELMELAGEHPDFEYGKDKGKYMLCYVGQDDPFPSEPAQDWQTKAVEFLKDICDSSGLDPNELTQPVINNRIARAKYPLEHIKAVEAEGKDANNVGVSDRALEAVTESDRDEIRNEILDESQVRADIKEEIDRATTEAEPVTDGGQSGNK